MCTICGIVTDEPGDEHLRETVAMLATTRHRGPDSCGLVTGASRLVARDPAALAAAASAARLRPSRIILAQSRLTITGGNDGAQPFVSDDGTLAFAHNGEFYNHEELRRLLPDGGASCTTGSDSEVVARLVELHYAGDLVEAVRRALALANGMYAVAVTDGRTLVLARDPIGKKPVYYVDGPPFAFASERKALVALAARAGAAVRRLRPGEMLAVRPGARPVVTRGEALARPPVDVVDAEEAVRLYVGALEQSVRRRTRAVSRAAVLFSGGVDSVLVARLLQREGVDVTGYAVGVASAGDVAAAEAAAASLGMPLHVVRVDEADVERELPRMIQATELNGPLQVEVTIPMWFASRAAHEDGHRVVFTGQGADELFAGYDWYRNVVRESGHLELHERLWEDVDLLAEDTLEREDRITMAFSLELRAPFLDPDLMRLAMRIAPQLKCRGPDDLMRKHTHREAALRLGVPREIAFRDKSPAQDGAGVHTLLERVARRSFPEGGERDLVLPDFGSNYRYRDTLGAYGSREVRALLHDLVVELGIPVVDAALEIPPPALRRAAEPTRATARRA